MFWPKDNVAERREVEWKIEKDETTGKISKTEKNPKDPFPASMTASGIP